MSQFNRGREWVSTSLRFDGGGAVSFFETTIRVLGGLLSTFELSSDRMFLDRAVDLGNRLLTAFDTASV